MITKTLLIVGPQPPPVGGGTTSVQLLLDELAAHYAIQTIVINSSPHDQNKKTSLFKRGTLRRAILITMQYIRSVKQADAVLVFASNSFIFSIGSFLLLLARHYHVPFYLKPLGGDLNLFLETRNKWVRAYMARVLRAADGVLVQTKQLRTELSQLGCANAYYVPGYRPALPDDGFSHRDRGKFRVVFLSQILREKGPLLLLEALQILALEATAGIECDFYGPIVNEDRREFLTQLKATPGARYCGVAEVGASARLMAHYDILAFPTYFIGEGHPGVILEAMQAGIPVISTQFRSIPELITDGENGFLVPVGDSRALASAIMRLALNPRLRENMGRANYLRGQEFRADLVISRMMKIIFPEVSQSNND